MAQKKLCFAASVNDIAGMLSLLRSTPGLDVNSPNEAKGCWTALHLASYTGHVEIVKVLLAHPRINVNLKDVDGCTSIFLACSSAHVSVVRLLLKDPRVDATLMTNNDTTPLWDSSFYGELEVVEWLIASGRDLGDLNQKGKSWAAGVEYSTLEIAREYGECEVVSVLERFITNPTQT